MNSKQRVHSTLKGIEPDRVPIAEYAIDFDTVEKILHRETYLRTKAKLKIAVWEGRQDEITESYLKDHIELHEKFEMDIVTFPMATWAIPSETDDSPPRKIDDGTWEDKYGRVYKYSAITADITCVKDPVIEDKTLCPDEYKEKSGVPALDKRSWDIMDSVIERFKDEKFICGPMLDEIWVASIGLGMEKGSMEFLLNPGQVKKALEYIRIRQNQTDETLVHPEADAVLMGEDFGHKTATFVSPDMFREFFFEANKARVKNIHDKYNKKVFKHYGSNINPIMDMFVDIGWDVYHSIQPTADMDIRKTKK